MLIVAELHLFTVELLLHPVFGPIVRQPEWVSRLSNFERGLRRLHVAGTEFAIEIEDRVREIFRSRRAIQDRLIELDKFTGRLDVARIDAEAGAGTAAGLRGEPTLM